MDVVCLKALVWEFLKPVINKPCGCDIHLNYCVVAQVTGRGCG